MKSKNGSFGCFFILLIPIGVILLSIVINYCLDFYYQKKLDKDTYDVLSYIVTKDLPTADDYKLLAIEQFSDRGYKLTEETISVLSSDDFILLIKYEYITDLRSFVNIFRIKWTDKDGVIDESKINETMTGNTGMIVSKYIVRLNEYKEPIIEKFDGDEQSLFDELQEKDKDQDNQENNNEQNNVENS